MSVYATPNADWRDSCFEVSLADGSQLRYETSANADGVFRLLLDVASREITGMRVGVLGYEWFEWPASRWLGTDSKVRLTLARLPELRLRLMPPPLAEGEHVASVKVHACSLSLARRAALGFSTDGCCELGSSLVVRSASLAGEFEVALPVQRGHSYIVLVSGATGAIAPEVFGPFEPTGADRRIELGCRFVVPPCPTE